MFFSWSRTGNYHQENETGNQDRIVVKNKDQQSVIVLCDGMSSCKHADRGAEVSCNSAIDFLLCIGQRLLRYDASDSGKKILTHIRYDLQKEADRLGCKVEDLSSTFACTFYDKDSGKILLISIGDSLVGGVTKEKIEVIMEPSISVQGCPATTTKGVESVMQCKYLDASRYQSIFLCSDGIWKSFYKYSEVEEAVQKRLLKEEYGAFIQDLNKEELEDDSSFVVMEIK